MGMRDAEVERVITGGEHRRRTGGGCEERAAHGIGAGGEERAGLLLERDGRFDAVLCAQRIADLLVPDAALLALSGGPLGPEALELLGGVLLVVLKARLIAER